MARQGDEGFSRPRVVPEGVRVVGVSNMRDALEAAYRDEYQEEDKEQQQQQEAPGGDREGREGGEEHAEKVHG